MVKKYSPGFPQTELREKWRACHTLGLGLAGGLLLWAAFPPLNLPYLAWIAPLPWLWLMRMPTLPGKWPYAGLWLAGCIHWLLLMYGVRLAHPALNGGWVALAAYLGLYLPLFVGLGRVAVHRLNVSPIIAAPVVWVGLELIRGHLITGFSLGLLAHTQAEFPRLIQVADLAGGYTLSFAIMLVAACLARMVPFSVGRVSRPIQKQAADGSGGASYGRADGSGDPSYGKVAWWPLLPAGATVAAVLLYGTWRLNQTPPGAAGPSARVALIQTSLDTVFEPLTTQRLNATLAHAGSLTAQAVARQPNLDLVVWPESMFVVPETLVESSPAPPADSNFTAEEWQSILSDVQGRFRAVLADLAAEANANTDPGDPGTMLLVGTTTAVYRGDARESYNTALLADRQGNVAGRYHKMHAVMFGEYIPFGSTLPWIYSLTPMDGGMSIGSEPTAFDVAGLKFTPSICFESTVPHLIRGHVTQLNRRGTPADVLVNVTNDGWFWGSAVLDHHFRCGVFRAVENRKPLVVAANTGFSAAIDGNGVIQQRAPRRQPDVIVAEIRADGRTSPYHTLGDAPAWLLAAACVGLAAMGLSKPRLKVPSGDSRKRV